MGLLQKACETYDCHVSLVSLPHSPCRSTTSRRKEGNAGPCFPYFNLCTDRDYAKPGWEISKC